jgi:hypothetical protein
MCAYLCSRCTNGARTSNRVSSVTDHTRAHSIVTKQTIAEAEHTIREKCCVKMNNVATMLNIRHGSAQHIIHNMLQCHKVPAREDE